MLRRDNQAELGISDNTIAKRAYGLWEARGCPQGDGSEDWQLAKRQLLAEAHRRQRPLLRLLSRLRSRAAV
jgi:hypothetical protein